jgi:hypothetical protein
MGKNDEYEVIYTDTTGTQCSDNINISTTDGAFSSAVYGHYTLGAIYNDDETRFSVFKLSKNIMPKSVLFNGSALTLGVVGSDAECVFMGDHLLLENKIIGHLSHMRNKPTLIIEYTKEILHFTIENYNVIYAPSSKILESTLISTISKEQ